tara:strand:- start:385 stop:816 length:432 start_codon:yes stop_codon:yes gene_type:complete
MAKVSRSVLKEIVKECLLEILFEGIDSESGYEEREPIREVRQRRTSRPSRSHAKEQAKTLLKEEPRPQLREAPVNAAVSELTQDPMMAAIFADTAKTTLIEQREKRRPPIDQAAAVIEEVDDMSQIFEGAGNWASIAFGEIEN